MIALASQGRSALAQAGSDGFSLGAEQAPLLGPGERQPASDLGQGKMAGRLALKNACDQVGRKEGE